MKKFLFVETDLQCMVQFKATIQQFEEKGEKTGWTHLLIPSNIVQKIFPGNKKIFRVKGKIDDYTIAAIALLPMGNGSFVMPLNATIRKGIKKRKGVTVIVSLQVDDQKIKPSAELIECLSDEPKALEFFNQLSLSHQNYFSNWIKQAKTDTTKAKRIAHAVNALSRGWHFGIMMKTVKENKTILNSAKSSFGTR